MLRPTRVYPLEVYVERRVTEFVEADALTWEERERLSEASPHDGSWGPVLLLDASVLFSAARSGGGRPLPSRGWHALGAARSLRVL